MRVTFVLPFLLFSITASAHTCLDMAGAFNSGDNKFGAELVSEGLLAAYQTDAEYSRPDRPRILDINLEKSSIVDETTYLIMAACKQNPRAGQIATIGQRAYYQVRARLHR